jgi:aconitase B
MGDDIPHVPNKRGGGLFLGGKIAPIFFNTMEDAGALPIEVDVSNLNMGDVTFTRSKVKSVTTKPANCWRPLRAENRRADRRSAPVVVFR